MKMYELLYEAWINEKKSDAIQGLPEDFYVRIIGYVKKLRAESRMLDERSVKARVLRRKVKNVEAMIKELLWLRWEKIVHKIFKGERVSENVLTLEERQWSRSLALLFEDFQSFCDGVLKGKTSKPMETQSGMVVLRFLDDVPAIVGADMRTYGPFKAEDVATLPSQNARILVKRGVAVRVELSR